MTILVSAILVTVTGGVYAARQVSKENRTFAKLLDERENILRSWDVANNEVAKRYL